MDGRNGKLLKIQQFLILIEYYEEIDLPVQEEQQEEVNEE